MMEKIKLYLKETTDELLYKVTWPTWAELQSSAIIVVVASLIISIIIYIMDISSSKLLNEFYKMFV